VRHPETFRLAVVTTVAGGRVVTTIVTTTNFYLEYASNKQPDLEIKHLLEKKAKFL
jgi:hypothetical protein